MKRCGGAVWSLLVHSLSLTHSLSVGWLVGWLLVVFTAKFVRWFVRWFVRCRSLSFVRFDSMVRSFVRLSVGKSLVDRWFVRCRSLIAVLLLRSFVCLFVRSFACSLSLVRCSNYVRWTENFLRCLGVGVVVVAAAGGVCDHRRTSSFVFGQSSFRVRFPSCDCSSAGRWWSVVVGRSGVVVVVVVVVVVDQQWFSCVGGDGRDRLRSLVRDSLFAAAVLFSRLSCPSFRCGCSFAFCLHFVARFLGGATGTQTSYCGVSCSSCRPTPEVTDSRK